MSRRGRDPAAPMPAQSAFLLYQDAMKDSLVRENPGLSLAELGKLAAGRFSTIPQRDKAVWDAHSEADKSRYYDELSAYVPAPGYNQNGDEIIHGMDATAPVEPKTALMFFRDALREQFEAENPAGDFQKLFARYIPHMFGSLSADEKAVWEMRSAQDQLRYETELATYESQTAQQLAANAPTGGLSVVTPNIEITNSNDTSKSKKAKKKKIAKTKSKVATTSTGKPRTKTKSKERKERDPNAPKAPSGAYIFFMQELRPILKEQFPEMAFKELTLKLGEQWRGLTDEEKQVYVAMSDQDKKRYRTEMEQAKKRKSREDDEDSSCSSSSHSSESEASEPIKSKSKRKPAKAKKAKKDPNKPKGASSAFIFYCREERPRIAEKYKNIRLGDMGVKLGEQWRALSTEEKSKYVAMADADRRRYRREMDEYEG